MINIYRCKMVLELVLEQEWETRKSDLKSGFKVIFV